ncbi:DUF4275 family protein [Sporosarcina sp. ACRSM]|uniref:DUF4275 family protein n=1 Tax=Sporosarcina sp. ACRSM TaxID=2918216 RepID=UPI001EF71E6F|nr:DUF4275 family protein [Sporosarcina sp. ACRSM]MCG7333791.1 DUF4275 family protein [Sporosarcina sp. ACRSM]
MNFRKELQVLAIPKWGGYLRKSWENIFTDHLSTEQKEEIYLDSFLWHLCSWEAVNCTIKGEAIELFNQQKKDKCTIFYQYIDEAYLVENAKSLGIQDLPYDRLHMFYGDIYVMDWELKWTFMMTHEEECGPYFISR